MLAILSGLAAQFGLQLLAAFYGAWSTTIGKLVMAIVIAGGLGWLASCWFSGGAYNHGVADTQAQHQWERIKAIEGARVEGEARSEELERASASEEAALREIEARKLKVRNETKIADRVLLSDDDPWLRSKRK